MSKTLNRYGKFVDGVTSDASKDFESYIDSLKRLHEQGCDIARLDTAFTGLCSEAGEANDLVKKLKFHGKEYTDEIRQHLIKELGDVSWYWMNACLALGVDPDDVLERNIEKLESRYPGGKFDIYRSENRSEEDI